MTGKTTYIFLFVATVFGFVAKMAYSANIVELDTFAKSVGTTAAEIEQRMKLLFDMIDTDKSSIITLTKAIEWGTKLRDAVQKSHSAMTFEEMDVNKDGKISREELHGFLGDSKEDASVDKRFDLADLDKDGTLNYKELVTLISPSTDPNVLEAEIDMIIEEHDKDGDGKLSQDEYAVGADISESYLADALEEFKRHDKNGDSFIDREEIAEAISDPQEVSQAIHDLFEDMNATENGINLEKWMDNLEIVAPSVITNMGGVLVAPSQYDIDSPFPFTDIESSPSTMDEL